MWIPEGWGVFDESSCPDPESVPNHWYKKYTISSDKYGKLFNKLMGLKERLERERIVPIKGSERKIFPDISSLLSD